MAVLTPSNVLMTVDSGGNLWFYTTDNKILWGMNTIGEIFYQKNLSNIDTLTQIVLINNGTSYTIYCTTESSNNVFFGTVATTIVWATYIVSPESTATIHYLILSKDNTVLYQIYTNDNIYACIGGENSSALNFPGILSAYAEQKPLYPTAITVVTQPTFMGNFECKTINYIPSVPPAPPAAPVAVGFPVEISSSSVPFAQLISE